MVEEELGICSWARAAKGLSWGRGESRGRLDILARCAALAEDLHIGSHCVQAQRLRAHPRKGGTAISFSTWEEHQKMPVCGSTSPLKGKPGLHESCLCRTWSRLTESHRTMRQQQRKEWWRVNTPLYYFQGWGAGVWCHCLISWGNTTSAEVRSFLGAACCLWRK